MKKERVRNPLKTSNICRIVFGTLHYLLDFAPIIALITVAVCLRSTLAPVSVACLVMLIALAVVIFIFQCIKNFNFKTLFAVFSLGLICLGTVANIIPFVIAFCCLTVSDELIINPLFKHFSAKFKRLKQVKEEEEVRQLARK